MPTKLSPVPTLYLKVYDPDDTEIKTHKRVLKRIFEVVGCVQRSSKKRKENIPYISEGINNI
jgi:hypothetical protein